MPPPAVFALPPWRREEWKCPRVSGKNLSVTGEVLQSGQELAAALHKMGIEPSLKNAASCRLGAVVSGTLFDNACSTRLICPDDPDCFQELSVYLTRGDVPVCEFNLANLCAWASRDARPSQGSYNPNRIKDTEELAAFADSLQLQMDWHEPFEEELGCSAIGYLLDRSAQALTIQFDLALGDGHTFVSQVFLADLIAWAAGWEEPPETPTSGTRFRVPHLAE